MKDTSTISMIGIVKIQDKQTKEIILEETNHIHKGNMAFVLASSLATIGSTHYIKYMKFGSGASEVTSTGQISYRAPRVSIIKDDSVTLYEETYFKIINPASSGNSIAIAESNQGYFDVICTCTLEYNEPPGQDTLDYVDIPGYNNNDYIFDEICLETASGYMITHKISHPILKSMNRSFEIEYTLRIQIA